MTSYSRIYYEPYDIDTNKAVGEPTDFASACLVAQMSLQDCSVRWHHSVRLTSDRVRKATVRDFFDDPISRAIRTTEVVPAIGPDLHNEIAEEGCGDRCFCGCKYWEYDRCIDCGTHVTTVRSANADEPEGCTCLPGEGCKA